MAAPSMIRESLRLSSPATRLSLRSGLAAAAAVAVSSLFDLGHGYWVILTVLIVTKANLGGTVLRSKERIIGTLLGAVIGLPMIFLLEGHTYALLVLLAIALAVYALIGQISYYILAATVTVQVFLLFGLMGADPASMLSERLLDTVLGTVLGTAFSLILLPDTARSRLRRKQADALEQFEAALAYLQERRRGASIDLARYRSIIAANQDNLSDCETLRQEAAHEPGQRLFLNQSGRINAQLKILHTEIISMAGPMRRLGDADLPRDLAASLDPLDEAVNRELACTVEALRTGNPGDLCGKAMAEASENVSAALERLRDTHEAPDRILLDAALHARRSNQVCEDLRTMRQFA
ncbi:MAG: FUSC family protein [Desulfovibrionaceae bacterium]